MNPVDAVRSVLTQYATFRGRARRSEYWWFVLAYFVALLVAVVLDAAVFQPLVGTSPVTFLVGLGLIVPTLAVVWRRLHDTDRSGAFYFLGFIPLVGPIILIVFLALDSTPGPNRFGPSPEGVGQTTYGGYGPGQGYGPSSSTGYPQGG